MGNRNNEHLSNDASAKEIKEWLGSHIDDQGPRAKKGISAIERGKVRRCIEEIKERNRLKEVLGDDYDLLDS